MMRKSAFICIILATALAAGCSQQTAEQQAAQETTEVVAEETVQLTAAQQELVDKAVAIAKALEETPEAMAGVLASYSMSEEDFNELFYEIAGDPVLTDAYEAARAGS